MTQKQCKTCKFYPKTKDLCFLDCKEFMSSKFCNFYEQGDFSEIKKEFGLNYD